MGSFYPMDQVQYLDFLVNGHYGMRAGTMTRWTLRRTRINGAENKLHFEVNGKKHAYPFFFIISVLRNPVLLKLGLSQFFCDISANMATVFQDGIFIELEEAILSLYPSFIVMATCRLAWFSA
jgi:hypothetical protein